VSFAAIILCVAAQRVLIFVVYFVIDSVWKFFDTPLYLGRIVLGTRCANSLRVRCPGPTVRRNRL